MDEMISKPVVAEIINRRIADNKHMAERAREMGVLSMVGNYSEAVYVLELVLAEIEDLK